MQSVLELVFRLRVLPCQTCMCTGPVHFRQEAGKATVLRKVASETGRLWTAMPPAVCTSLSSPPAASTKARQGQVLSLSCATSKSTPWGPCGFSAGLHEQPSSQLVCCPGPSVSAFPALHDLSISANYICHFPLPGDCKVSRLFQTVGEKVMQL